MRGMMAELTDETNRARGFSLKSVAWAVGITIGFGNFFFSFVFLANITARPFIGGVLSRPQDRWPNLFSHPFWSEFPYFLPCLAISAYALVSFSLTATFLKEVGSLLLQKALCLSARLDCEQQSRHEVQHR